MKLNFAFCIGFALVTPAVIYSDVVTDWNNITIQAIRADATHPGPTWASRHFAMVHVAIYDAVNAIDQTHQPFHVAASAPPDASREAAAAQAAYRVLATLHPTQRASLDAALATTLASVAEGPGKAAGIALGDSVGAEIVAWRSVDGSSPEPPFTPGTNPGEWRPTAPDFTPALGPGWGKVVPFAMNSGAQFRPPPPPALTSAEYAAAFNEVKTLGAKESSTRTAEQTQIGMFWGYDRQGMGPPLVLYNQIAQTIAAQRGNSLTENVRLFALINIAMADAGISCWDCKYLFNLWRPITAIREADADGNPVTEADLNWEPLGAPGGGVVPNFTPPFPAFTSGHATFGAALFRTLRHFYATDALSFTLSSDELPGVERSFSSFSQAAAENGVSRIYLGIHWQFDNLVGQAGGRAVADHVYAQFLTPRLAIGQADARLVAAWPRSSRSFLLATTDSLSPPVSWLPIALPSEGPGGLNVVSILPVSPVRFFKLALIGGN